MEIKSRFNDNIVLASGDGTLKDVAEKNRSNLRNAVLCGADLYNDRLTGGRAVSAIHVKPIVNLRL